MGNMHYIMDEGFKFCLKGWTFYERPSPLFYLYKFQNDAAFNQV